jgi:xanthine dehydrogenase YagS FAD-binding subunit
MKNFEHVNAASPAGAVSLLNQNHNSRTIAGGTDLFAEMRLGIVTPDRLVNLKTIPGLADIRFDEKSGLQIGALATLDDIAGNNIISERYPILFKAISVAASPQLRNRGTIAGNLCQDSRCWYYRGQFRCWLKGGETCYAREGENGYHAIFDGGPCYTVHPSDPAPALIALDARLLIIGKHGERTLFLEELYRRPHLAGRRLTVLEPDEIITEINLPVPAKESRGTYIKAMERRVWSFALASVAAQITFDNNIVKDSRLVLGGVAPKPWRLKNIESALLNMPLDDQTIDRAVELVGEGAQPLSHNGYKVPLVKGILKEGLLALRS